MALSSKDLEISSCVAHFCWQECQALDHSVDCYGYTSRQVKILALGSSYCHQHCCASVHLGQQEVSKRGDEQNRPLTGCYFTNSMQLVLSQNL